MSELESMLESIDRLIAACDRGMVNERAFIERFAKLRVLVGLPPDFEGEAARVAAAAQRNLEEFESTKAKLEADRQDLLAAQAGLR